MDKKTEKKECIMKTVVKTNDILAAMNAASKDETRRLLCGVNIEVLAGVTTVTATDSFRLVSVESDEGEADGSVTLDLTGIKFKKNQPVCIEFDGESATILMMDGSKVSPPVIEGNYPNWRQLMPERSMVAESKTGVSFNPKYVADMGKALATWKNNAKEPLTIEFAGVTLYTEKHDGARSFRGIIMPVRNDSFALKQPVENATARDVRKLTAELEAARNVNETLVAENESLKSRLEEKATETVEEDIEVIDQTEDDAKDEVEEAAEVTDTTTAVTVDTIRELVGDSCAVIHKNDKSCIWVVGDTAPFKDQLKELGLKRGTSKKHGRGYYLRPEKAVA